MLLNWLELTVQRNRVSKKEPPRTDARGGSVACYFNSSIVQQLRGVTVSLVILVSGP